ncbi:energy transducer TonB [Curvibacter sp. PAE-UM]|uniref:energy transducer TonB n=1 Tax=Curvibacter sp. PAE-UM TaxID=1714344 RepID=UPI0009E9C373|nr:energy transducer TonB [Curvibacter sp. PAE-UM]
MNRRLLIAASVVLLHVGVLWALQSGLMRRAVEVIIPGEILSEFISPPAPEAQKPQTPAPPRKPEPAPPKAQVQPPTPQPVTATAPAPAVAQAAPAAIEASTVAAAPAAPPAPARIELPSSDAAYLNNPKPSYPPLSRRLGEQGKVVVRVLIGVDGTAQQAEIRSSSGYDRLDQAALATVRSWRYVPGRRNGMAEAMWFNVPINFVLE